MDDLSIALVVPLVVYVVGLVAVFAAGNYVKKHSRF